MKIDNRQQILGIAAIAIVALFLLDRVVIRAYAKSWKDRSEKITQLEKSIREGKEAIERGPRVESKWSEMKTNTLSAANAERRLLEAFQKWSRASDISISSIRPQWKRGDEEHMTLECHANAAGPVKAMAQFLYNIETDPMALRVEAVEIQSRDENGQNLVLSLQVSGLALGTFEQ